MNLYPQSFPVTAGSARKLPNIDSGISNDEIDIILAEFEMDMNAKTKYHLGYPYNLDFDCRQLHGLLKYSINNLGDPFIESNYGVHSRMFEIAVLDWFASLWDISKHDYWGYITACGTEGNLHGLYVGRENTKNGVLYASEESHYSVFKAARMYKIELEKIKCNKDGTINIDDLQDKLAKNKNLGKQAIINVNVGTTLKGGIDDLDSVIESLRVGGYAENEFYIHCDGALVGIMVSFLEKQYLTFKKPIGSISVSGHKFIGSPVPCGVIITKLDCIKVLSNDIDYINSRDATIMGSRNGHGPLYLWYTLVKKGKQGIQYDVLRCIDNAKYLAKRLIEIDIQEVAVNKWSNTVVFKEPCAKITKKWQLACSGGLCHIVVMPNVDISKLDCFIADLCLISCDSS